jgi:hypothetical protein
LLGTGGDQFLQPANCFLAGEEVLLWFGFPVAVAIPNSIKQPGFDGRQAFALGEQAGDWI